MMMTGPTVPDNSKDKMRASFNDLAPTYDQLRFLQLCASRLAELAAIPTGARVLDVATGTGEAALNAAQSVGPSGQVVGVDLSPEMLALARRKLARIGLGHVEFREGDAENLNFSDQSFDFVLCSSSLFFMPDMLGVLQEWRRVLAPGGRVGFSSFGPTFLQPLRDLWEARLRRYGLTAASLPTHRLADLSICEQLLLEAGFTDIRAHSEQLGYYLRTAEERWEDIQAGLEGKPLLSLNPSQREQVKAEHLTELAALTTSGSQGLPDGSYGIWVDVPAIFAFGQQTGVI